MKHITKVCDSVDEALNVVRDKYVDYIVGEATLRQYSLDVENLLYQIVPKYLTYSFECRWKPYYRQGNLVGHTLETSYSIK